MNRRFFLERAAGLTGAGSLWASLSGASSESGSGSEDVVFSETRSTSGSAAPRSEGPQEAPNVHTVTGPIAPEDLGMVLPHEHVMSRFGGPAVPDPAYPTAHLYEVVVPYLKFVRELGVDTLCDCTAAYFGRDPRVLRELSERSGMRILTNTGYYGAAGDTYVPEHAYEDSVDRLAGRWVREYEEGIGGSGIRPGFIKIGIDEGPLSSIDRKLVEAAAETHLETGLTIAVHTSGNPEAVRQQLRILEEAGVDPSAWIWVHAQNVDDTADLSEAVGAGGWIEFDGLAAETLDRHLELVGYMRDRDRLDRVLLSHDGNSHSGVNEPIRHYDVLMTTFLGMLRSAGYAEEEIRRMTVENPREAFTPRVRTS